MATATTSGGGVVGDYDDLHGLESEDHVVLDGSSSSYDTGNEEEEEEPPFPWSNGCG